MRREGRKNLGFFDYSPKVYNITAGGSSSRNCSKSSSI